MHPFIKVSKQYNRFLLTLTSSVSNPYRGFLIFITIMDISALGEFGLIDRIIKGLQPVNQSTIKGTGDDCCVIDAGGQLSLMSTDLLMEGVHFDLTYTPLRHLGYKTVVAGISDIFAMNGSPKQILIALGISQRFTVEDIDTFYEGVAYACKEYGVDLAGGDTTASLTGLTICISVHGEVSREKIVYRSEAGENDLVCVSGDLGAAYMGAKLLEREKRVLEGNDVAQPRFEGYEKLLERQLMPKAPRQVVALLDEYGILPTAMIDISDGLASEMLHICKSSGKGARIYLYRLPIAEETYALAEEMNIDPVVAALNGGEDYELLFTVPLEEHDRVLNIPGIRVIGHITPPEKGAALITPDGEEIPLTAQGWVGAVCGEKETDI